jgi:tryptophan synthase alpha chain
MAERTAEATGARLAGPAGAARIASAFELARSGGRAALMPYMMGGFPDQDTANAVAEAYVGAGADLIELGVPFSDPLADGPVIHAADTAALRAGATLDSVLETCASVAARVPVLTMIYANMLLGDLEGHASRLASAGAVGAIVPDLPLEEAPPVRRALNAAGLALVPLVAPTTPDERRRAICDAAQGFVYLVSTVGTTGERGALPPELADLIEATRADAAVPVAVGFGISSPEHAAAVGERADGVIIGSRLVREVADAPDRAAAAAGVSELLRATAEALSR